MVSFALLFLLFPVFVFSALVESSGDFKAVVEHSGFVDIFYRCGAYVHEFGSCGGDCLGFMMAIRTTHRRPPVRVYVGDVEVPVAYRLYRVDDVYQPNLWIIQFRATAVGKIKVETELGIEAYLLINFGTGDPRYLKALFLPYYANRTEQRSWASSLGAEGRIVACTVGKYASRAEVLTKGGWTPAAVSTGWYHSVVSGYGSAVRLYWSDTPQSAIKVAFVLLTAPRAPERAYVVGLDGLPVPAEFLRFMVGPGVTVEDDGVVSFVGSGYLSYGGRRVELRPNATVIVEGRRCVYMGMTSGGEPLNISVFFEGRQVKSGRGGVETFCLPSVTKARYTYVKRYTIANVTHIVESEGNFTLQLVKIEVVVANVFGLPAERYSIEAPPGHQLRIYLTEFNYSTTAEVSQVAVKWIYPYDWFKPWELLFLLPPAAGVVAAMRRKIEEFINMSTLTAVVLLFYVAFVTQLSGWKLTGFIAYLSFVVFIMGIIVITLFVDVVAAVAYITAAGALGYIVLTSLHDFDSAVVALAATSILVLKSGELLSFTSLGVRLRRGCRCAGDLTSAKREAYRRAEEVGPTSPLKMGAVYIRELARLCKIRVFGKSTEDLALCMALGGLISSRLHVALSSGNPEEVAEALRSELI